MRDAVWARLALMYRAELGTLPDADRKMVLIALEQLTDFESWGPHAQPPWPFNRGSHLDLDRRDRPAPAPDTRIRLIVGASRPA